VRIPDRVRAYLDPIGERAESLVPLDPDPIDPVIRKIDRAIEERAADFTLGDALAIPAVFRAVDLLCSHAAALSPVAYVDGEAAESQPRIVARPIAWETRRDFIYETMYSLLAGGPRGGDAYWLSVDRDDHGYTRQAMLLDPAEVDVQWDELRLRRRYRWRGEDVAGEDVTHIRIGPRPGELHGRSPLVECLPRLAIIGAAERYASAFFATGGIPEVVLKSGVALTGDEATELRNQYVGDGERWPVRVVSGDIALDFPGADPERSQLAQTRAYAATEVSRLLGIPGPLMLIETSGATVTYANAQAALSELYRDTLVPTYLDPIEEAWSDLLPSTTVVRFDLYELLTADPTTRAAILNSYVASGVLGIEEARIIEGLPAAKPITTSPRVAPTIRPTIVRLPSVAKVA
jgi:HK97 family phage portal protein